MEKQTDIILKATVNCTNKLKLMQELQNTAHACGCKIDIDDDGAEIEMCRMGYIHVQFSTVRRYMVKNLTAVFTANTSRVGAGFHAAVVRLVNELCSLAESTAQWQDPTDYAVDADMQKLQKYFCEWLKKSVASLPQKSAKNLYLAWGAPYKPQDFAGTVVTPLGRFDIVKLATRVKTKGIDYVAKNMFIWENEDKDAYFYRNSALNIMWQDCRLVPSSRSDEDFDTKEAAIEMLQKAMELDRSIPYPIQDYLELCRFNLLRAHTVDDLTPLDTDYMIGYREHNIAVTHGNIEFKIQGSFLHSVDEEDDADLYSDEGDLQWRIVRVSTLVQLEEETEFRLGAFQGAEEEPHYFSVGKASCKAAFLGSVLEENEEYFQLAAQVNFAGEKTMFLFSFSDISARDWAMGTILTLEVSAPQGNERSLI